MQIHSISPLYNPDSRILILGSFPSVKSREEGFFYAHPQNRFWIVLSKVFSHDTPHTIDEKKDYLIKNRIALWDVIASCDIEGSSDATISNVMPNDVGIILKNSNIEKIYLNGKTAQKYYERYLKEDVSIEAITLPSTSPANAAWSIEKLTNAWSQIKASN